MMTNSVQHVAQASDLEAIQAITAPLRGEICWRANFSYGDELALHFGDRKPYKIRSKEFEEGSWIFGSRGTEWQLESPTGILVTSEASREEMEAQVKKLEGSAVEKLEIGFPRLDLAMSFNNGLCLRLLPVPEDDEYEISYWELFTPDDYLLEVGPRRTWAYRSADEPKEAIAQN